MPEPRTDVVEFLLTRRSRPAKTLSAPAPDRAALETILQAGARTPDHGMLEPWRFIVLQGAALARISGQVAARARAKGLADEMVEKAAGSFANAPATIVVVASPKASEKIPDIEQTLSAGAACLAVLNCALALGWGANWVTGWMAFDRPLLSQAFELAPEEYVAGFIQLGTETVAPGDRPRPDPAGIARWLEA